MSKFNETHNKHAHKSLLKQNTKLPIKYTRIFIKIEEYLTMLKSCLIYNYNSTKTVLWIDYSRKKINL